MSETLLHYGIPEFDTGSLLLVVAVGLALVPLLPTELRRPSLVVPLVPVLGIVVSPLLLVSAATVGLSLTGLSIRLLTLGFTLVALAVSRLTSMTRQVSSRPGLDWRIEAGLLLLLAAIVVLGATVSAAVVGRPPVPGPDWGHYLLYAEQIRERHSLLVDNPFWMGGGRTFSQDPAAPSLYGAYLLLGSAPAGVLVQGIWFFWVLAILSVFVFGTALWGGRAGLVAAALWAVLPAGLNMLSWHGLAQTYALAILPLAALCVGAILRDWLDWRWALLLGVSGAALLGGHRLTALVACAACVPPLAVAAARRPRAVVPALGASIGFALLFGGGLAVHLARLYERTGRPPDGSQYLARKADWSAWTRDLTWVVIVLGIAATVTLMVHPRTRRDLTWLVPVWLIAGPALLAYAWLVDVPLDYMRMGYYVALGLVAATGAVFGRLLPRGALPLVLVPLLVVSVKAHDLAPQYRAFYQLVDGATARGLTQLERTSQSHRDLVVADACWAFLAPWLLQRPTLGALENWGISVRQELGPAKTARRILYGGGAGRRLARRHGVRYVLLDPKCWSPADRRRYPSIRGKPLFASNRLLILELSRRRDG